MSDQNPRNWRLPNVEKYPILSYVLARHPDSRRPPESEHPTINIHPPPELDPSDDRLETLVPEVDPPKLDPSEWSILESDEERLTKMQQVRVSKRGRRSDHKGLCQLYINLRRLEQNYETVVEIDRSEWSIRQHEWMANLKRQLRHYRSVVNLANMLNHHNYDLRDLYESEAVALQNIPPNSKEVELLARMPLLQSKRELLRFMVRSISTRTDTDDIFQTLAEPPNQSVLIAARATIEEKEKANSEKVVNILITKHPWKGIRDFREQVEHELSHLVNLIWSEKLHQLREHMLSIVEHILFEIYEFAEEEEYKTWEEDEDSFGIPQEEEEDMIMSFNRCLNLSMIEDMGLIMQGLLPSDQQDLISLIIKPSQRTIILNQLHLEVLPQVITKLEWLKELNLASNYLIELPDSIGLLPRLNLLDVYGNFLKVLPDSISCCRSLIILDASSNMLIQLPDDIGYGRMGMKELYIHHNRLTYLPTSTQSYGLINVLGGRDIQN